MKFWIRRPCRHGLVRISASWRLQNDKGCCIRRDTPGGLAVLVSGTPEVQARVESILRAEPREREWIEIPEIDAEIVAERILGIRRDGPRPSPEPLYDTEKLAIGAILRFFT